MLIIELGFCDKSKFSNLSINHPIVHYDNSICYFSIFDFNIICTIKFIYGVFLTDIRLFYSNLKSKNPNIKV